MERIKDYAHELAYRERKQVEDNLAWKYDKDLIKEYNEANTKLNSNQTWGAAISALLEWKHELEREIRRRGLIIPA